MKQKSENLIFLFTIEFIHDPAQEIKEFIFKCEIKSSFFLHVESRARFAYEACKNSF